MSQQTKTPPQRHFRTSVLSKVAIVAALVAAGMVFALFLRAPDATTDSLDVAPDVAPLQAHQIEKVDFKLQHFAVDTKGNLVGANRSTLFRITEKGGKPAYLHKFGERINSVHVMAGGEIVVATDQDHWDPNKLSLIYISTDDGQVFKLIKLIRGGSALWWSIASDKSGRLYVGEYGPRENGQSKSVHMTADLGLTWTVVFKAHDNDETHIHRVAVDPYTDDVWVTVGDGEENRGAWRSTDSGGSFNKIVDTQATSMAFTEKHIYFGEDRRTNPGISRFDRRSGALSTSLDLAGEFDSGGSVYSLAIGASGALYASNMKYPDDDHTSSLWRLGAKGWEAILAAPDRFGGGSGFESIGGPDRFGYMYVNGFRILDPKTR